MMRFCTVVALLLFFNSVAFAQLQGAVSFNSEGLEFKKSSLEQKTDVSEENNQAKKETKHDAKEILAKRMEANRYWDNPRFVKATYGSLKGMQQSIDKKHQEALDEQKITDEAERQKALKQMQDGALVNFKDYEEESQIIHQKMNENPRESILDLTSRISYIDSSKMTDSHSEYITNKLEDNFMQNQGVSMGDYQKAFVEQLQNQKEVREKEASKAKTFPPAEDAATLKVEKVDEANALIHVGVKAPQSKK
ncbi:MAG: hypothetical protein E7013_06135 [Alphaproteobacteria bacterium]|nr:hypothetical protein [Alphaproteobacteria bacterium]